MLAWSRQIDQSGQTSVAVVGVSFFSFVDVFSFFVFLEDYSLVVPKPLVLLAIFEKTPLPESVTEALGPELSV